MARINEYLQALFTFRLYCHGLVMCGTACSAFISATISRNAFRCIANSGEEMWGNSIAERDLIGDGSGVLT